MTPVGWALRPFRRYADFTGRSPRAEYWWFILGVTITGFLLGVIDVLVLGGPIYGDYGPLGLAFTLSFIIPGLAVLVRRLHDTDRTGWWALVKLGSYALMVSGGSPRLMLAALPGLVPKMLLVVLGVAFGIAALAVFLFVVTEGDGGPNRYGPDPYGPDELEQVFA